MTGMPMEKSMVLKQVSAVFIYSTAILLLLMFIILCGIFFGQNCFVLYTCNVHKNKPRNGDIRIFFLIVIPAYGNVNYHVSISFCQPL